jgi:hypothetical protein
MKKDGVSIAFDMILEEMSAVEEQLVNEGQSAFKERRYKDAEKLTETGNKLLAFRQKLESLKNEWKDGIDIETRERIKVAPDYTIAPHKKSPKTALKVILPTGKIIQRSVAADTFADVIEALGLENIRNLDLSVNGVPLVSQSLHEKYNQKKRGAYYIVTHSNTETKKSLLLEIGKKLGQKLHVEIV